MASERTVRISDEVLTMVHAFDDQGRKDGVRELAGRVRALEDALARVHAEDCPCGAWSGQPYHHATCYVGAALGRTSPQVSNAERPER